jgi:hypothetical protein
MCLKMDPRRLTKLMKIHNYKIGRQVFKINLDNKFGFDECAVRSKSGELKKNTANCKF